MSIQDFSDKIVNSLSIDWSMIDKTMFADTALTNITNSIYAYFDDKNLDVGTHKNIVITGIATGFVGVAPATSPYTDPTITATIQFPPAATLKTLINTNMGSMPSTHLNASQALWTALTAWFALPMVVTLKSGTSLTSIATLVGVFPLPITFPVMSTFMNPLATISYLTHYNEMVATPSTTLADSWSSYAKYILLGCSGAIVSPIIAPLATSVAGPFAGGAVLTVTFP